MIETKLKMFSLIQFFICASDHLILRLIYTVSILHLKIINEKSSKINNFFKKMLLMKNHFKKIYLFMMFFWVEFKEIDDDKRIEKELNLCLFFRN